MQVVTKEQPNGSMGIILDGALDASSSREFKSLLDNILQAGHQRLVIDMGKVDFVDSSGLGTLVSLLKKVRESGGSLQLSEVSAPIMRIFAVTRLDKVFDFVSDEDAAA